MNINKLPITFKSSQDMIKFLKRINWVWIGLIIMSFTIWYYIIKLIRSVL